jgi:hypothetical protein
MKGLAVANDDKPTTQEKMAVAVTSGRTDTRNPRRTESADYLIANGWVDRYGAYEGLGGCLIYLDATNPDRAKDAPTVAQGPLQTRQATREGKVVYLEIERDRKHMEDRIAHEKREALELLTLIARKRNHPDVRHADDETLAKLVRLAFVEWYNRHCAECRGAGQMKSDIGVVHICGTCGGSKVRRFNDKERSEPLEMDRKEIRKWTPALSFLSGVIGDAIAAKVKAAAKMVNGW